MFGRIGPEELILILIVLLVIFGPSRLPDLGSSLGKSMRSFKKAVHGEDEAPAPPAPAPPALPPEAPPEAIPAPPQADQAAAPARDDAGSVTPRSTG